MGHNNRAAMRSPLNILIFVPLIAGQCEDTFPDGTACGAGDSILKPDMDSCWKYYECDDGCVKHVTCEEDYKYDIPYEWCSPPRDVDCGERPCNDAVHCPEDLTTTTKEPPCIPEDQIIDCRADEYGPGYYPDEYNCRAFWHCNKGESLGEHILCPQKSDDPKATMFDTTYMGCNFPEQTQCGGRPICDECNENCEDPPPPIDCGHDLDCSEKGTGWWEDPYSCVKYWNCQGSTATHFQCPDGLMAKVDEPSGVQCDFPDRVNCGNRPPCNECDDDCP